MSTGFPTTVGETCAALRDAYLARAISWRDVSFNYSFSRRARLMAREAMRRCAHGWRRYAKRTATAAS